ncbi:MAG: hypothetical protein E1N59_2560 [Puniceicoccaceae bacterium 5H]|nr:MAG: hypothetical protein E1N59_2560 [Puniceicoccaceae bacterium 5H]
MWASLVALLVFFAYYFNRVRSIPLEKAEILTLFAGSVVVLVVLQIALQVAVSLVNPKDAAQPWDERERLIKAKAGEVFGVVLAIGALFSASTAFFGAHPLQMANAILLSLVGAQIVECVVQLYYYRRGI